MGNTFISDIRGKAAKKFLKVAFPDAEDVRTLKAALILREKHIANPASSGRRPRSTRSPRTTGSISAASPSSTP